MDDAEADSIRNDVIEQIQTIFDSEIPVNIYELGLIYEVNVHENKAVNVIMTLTSPNCPAAHPQPNDQVSEDSEDLEAVTEAAVDVVWEPVSGTAFDDRGRTPRICSQTKHSVQIQRFPINTPKLIVD